ncbi:MAG: hypothetical protein JNL96_08435 [Planctomycetaceae bacterium]|nr:hypothetical protein [Planctomycetaceae bacterium]
MTKKFVNALSKDGTAAGRSRFLLPAIDGSAQFEEIGTGKRYDMGYVVYTGKELSPDDVAKKCTIEDSHLDALRRLIDSYLSEIAKFKVGNVVAIDHNADGQVRLRLISQMPKAKAGPKLP